MMVTAVAPKNNTVCFLHRKRGASLFEFVIVLAVIALLVGILLQRIHVVQCQAELAKVQQVVGVLRSTLRMKAAVVYAHGNSQEFIALTEQNPMRWLTSMPNNYLGEYYSPDIEGLESGSWYYDPGTNTLVYLMHNGNDLKGKKIKLLKFKQILLRAESERGILASMPYSIVLNEVAETLD
ncbi:type II secretion system protein [Massilia psychrophila]|uniref:Type II secretion system protein n=1 Tax=Massilia psychrophila TaxID=1603353 RepID=A0A2G8SYX1_9BURK|nr:hypothetical protein [Massilia psychrophila]PIL38986.1 hypothetical protein CR103_15000 [Massilia psychrophila]